MKGILEKEEGVKVKSRRLLIMVEKKSAVKSKHLGRGGGGGKTNLGPFVESLGSSRVVPVPDSRINEY